MKVCYLLLTSHLIFANFARASGKSPELPVGSGMPTADTARVSSLSDTTKTTKDHNLLLEFPNFSDVRKYAYLKMNRKAVLSDTVPFKPSIQVGAALHMFAFTEQDGYSNPRNAGSPTSWQRGFALYRSRILLGAQLTPKASFFMETELPSIIGGPKADSTKNVKVSPIILDAQLHYTFSNAFQLVIGQQLVSNNRNGLQGCAALMANDFSYFQYPYNMFENSPLQGNFGRDLGINARGFLLNDKLEYRAGVFTGRNIDGKGPLRLVGRFAYNFLDTEKDYYYAGTNLGRGETFTWAVGVDKQGSYYNLSTDVFYDRPLSENGSITLNGAFQYMTGGTNTTSKYSFATLIPAQTVQFLELGYYFKKVKLQPWVKFENQDISAKTEQTGGLDKEAFNKFSSSSVYGGGINYFFNDLGTNLRLSYIARSYNVANDAEGFDKKTYGQIWAQVQLFIF